MKAIINIATREVQLKYSVKKEDFIIISQEEKNKQFKDWEVYLKTKDSDYVCKHSLYFNDLDEWQSTMLFDGRVIDFHYDYEELKAFDCKSDWKSFIFQGYEFKEGTLEKQCQNVIEKITIKF